MAIGTGIIALIIAYLLGGIPTGYIITRLLTGKDIRKLGGGNAGARNVYIEVGKAAGIAVGAIDIAKGIAAVAIALFLLNVNLYFVLGAGIVAVAGHIWPVYLKFRGGNGLATAIGVLTFLMYKEMLIAVAVILVLWIITRNVILSVNLSLFSLPISAWLFGETWVSIVYPIALVIVMLLHFFPKIVADIRQAGTKENFFSQLLRRDKAGKGA